MKHRSDNHVRGERWHKLHEKRFVSNCAKCGKHGLKAEMPGLYLRRPYDSHRILCHLCSDCLPRFLDELGVEMPE